MKLFFAILIILYCTLSQANSAESVHQKIKSADQLLIETDNSISKAEGIAPDHTNFVKNLDSIKKDLAEALNLHQEVKDLFKKGLEDGSVGEAAKLQLTKKIQRLADIMASQNTKLTALYKKVPALPPGPPGPTYPKAAAISQIQSWIAQFKKLEQTDAKLWLSHGSTILIYHSAGRGNGFYPQHNRVLLDSIININGSSYLLKSDFGYLNDGVQAMFEVHRRISTLMDKIILASDADLPNSLKKAETYIYPYLTIKLFSSIGSRNLIPVKLPKDMSDELGCLPNRGFANVYATLPSGPPIGWIRKNKYVLPLLKMLHDMGVSDSFIQLILDSGVQFKVELVKGQKGINGVYFGDTDTIKIPHDYYFKKDKKFRSDSGFITTLLHELYHAYSDQIINSGKDATGLGIETVALESWLASQQVKKENSPNSWYPFSKKVDDTEDFAEEYIAAIVNELAQDHIQTLKRSCTLQSSARLSKEAARKSFQKNLQKIYKMEFSAYENNKGRIVYTVKGPAPKTLINLLVKIYGFGKY